MQNAQVAAKGDYRAGRFLAPCCLNKIKQLHKTKKVRHKVPDLQTSGRDDWIRTSDPLTPSQVRYQAAPRPEAFVCCSALARNREYINPELCPCARTFLQILKQVQNYICELGFC